jgi:hypothetical protein
VLFSDTGLSHFINAHFEPVWEMTRPVPKVQIDFGDGNIVTRTLRGNIATFICMPTGQVFDVLPGLYEPATYKSRLREIVAGIRALADSKDDISLVTRSYHTRQQQMWLWNSCRLIARLFASWIQSRPTQDSDDIDPSIVNQWAELYLDTAINATINEYRVHCILRNNPAPAPKHIGRKIYRDILRTDVDDPYLGLGPALFDNYPFVS